MSSPRTIGSLSVSPIGFGCMNLSHAYGKPPSSQDAERVLMTALELGVTHFDTAALYGFGANEQLVGNVLGPHRSRITLASKGGVFGLKTESGTRRTIDGRPQTLRANCEESLRNLRTDVIDLYYLHRWDKRVAIEESVGALAGLVAAGKIRHIGLSEVSAATLRRAHAIHPISAVQSEYSLVTRNPELGVLEACRELGVAFVAFSPVGRGIFSMQRLAIEEFDEKDIRRTMPRFDGSHYEANYEALAPLRALALELGMSLSQLALAWLLSRGPDVLPIPGSTHIPHVIENVQADRVFDEATSKRLEQAVQALVFYGNRYNAATRAEVDTEEWP
jgi:aryl-alcohol dehydrogenase-like predicted oxidoreductase